MKKHTWKIIIGVVILLLGGSIVYSQYASEGANEGVVLEPHIKGNPEAAVSLVKYSDFQCPACAQFSPFLTAIVEQYGEDLSFEYKHFPLITAHPYAVPAARAAEAAGQQGKFWEMHDLLFENQRAWSSSANPNALFEQYALELGLDMDTYKRHFRSSKIRDAVNQSYQEARELNLTGTPTLFLNGEEMTIETFADMEAQVVAAISEADPESISPEEIVEEIEQVEVEEVVDEVTPELN